VVPEEGEEETLDDASDADEQDQRSFILGFIAGVIGGCVVLALVLRRGKPTRAGAYWGFAVQVLLFFIASSRGT
jgi:hypothetical protein